MTDELTKTFFDTFGIEPKKEYYCPSCDTKLEEWKTEKGLYYMCGNCCECDYVLDSLDEEFEEILKNLSYRTEYPQITDRILLELICILSRHTTIGHYTMDGLKRQLLNLAIIHKKDILKQLRTLFEEG